MMIFENIKPLVVLLVFSFITSCTKAQTIKDIKIDVTKDKEINSLNKMLQSVAWETIYKKSNRKNFELFPFEQRKFAGVLTTFSNDSIFKANYVAPCGNDNFWAKYGKYKLLSDNKIAIHVDSIRFWGMDKRPTKYPKELTIYNLKKQDSTVTFLK